MPTKEKKPKARAHKESKHTGRGARPVKLTELEKFLIGGKRTRAMKRAGVREQLHTEEKSKKEAAEKWKKRSGHEGFQKLAGAQRRS